MKTLQYLWVLEDVVQETADLVEGHAMFGNRAVTSITKGTDAPI